MDAKEVVHGSIGVLTSYYHGLGLRCLRRKDRVMVFLDDKLFVEVEPRVVCIPCEHDEVEREKLVGMFKEAE